MILTGASCNDIFVIVLFSVFVSANQENYVYIATFANIPVSIIFCVFLGIIFSFGIYFVFETAFKKNHKIRGSIKVIILLAVSFLLVSIEKKLKNYIAVSGFFAVTAMDCVIRLKSNKKVSDRLSEKFGKLWIAAEILLFVLVVASVDMRYTFDAVISA